MIKGFGKICLLFFIYLYCNISSYAQSTLLGEKNWQTVLSGKVLSKPEPTSYGFVVITDGRLMNAFSETGSILWQKTLPEKGSGYSSSMNGDFIYTAINNTLSLYNTSGIALWTIKTKTPIIEKPLPGWDGRVFVREKNAISSYNLNGLLRFHLEVSEGLDFPLLSLNDGSILYLQKKSLGGKSTALRISPFGTIIEEIIFVDTIISAKENESGVLLALANGSLALCQVIDGISDTSWSIHIPNHSTQSNTAIQNIFPWNKDILIQAKDGSFMLFNGNNQKIEWETRSLEKNKIESFVFDNENAILFSHSRIILLSRYGTVEKNIQLENVSSLSSVTKSGYFIETRADWSIRAFRIASLKNALEVQKNQSKKYPLSLAKTNTNEIFKNASSLLQNELLFDKEALILSRLRLDIQDVQSSYLFFNNSSKNSFQTPLFASPLQDYDSIMALKIATIDKASKLGTSEAIDFFENILTNESDESIIYHCLKAIQKSAYDYNMGLIFAIEKKLHENKSISDLMLKEYCYTITEICRFMGRRVLIKKGKDLLFDFLDPKYSITVQNIARNCLEQVINFEK